jgi:hypothetical protein
MIGLGLYFYIFGNPIYISKLRNSEWKLVEDRSQKKWSSWIGKLLLYGDSLVLISFLLTSLLTFMLAFIEIPIKLRKC